MVTGSSMVNTHWSRRALPPFGDYHLKPAKEIPYDRYAYSSKIHHIKLLIKHLQPSKGQVYTCTYMYTASVNGKRNKGIPECNNFFNLHIHVPVYIYM